MNMDDPFATIKFGNKCVLVVKDYFTEWPEIYTITNQEAELVADVFINKWLTRLGIPMKLRSDQEGNLESVLGQDMYHKLGIWKTEVQKVRLRRY